MNIGESMEEEDRAYRAKLDDYTPASDGYTGDACANCGRCRVIPYEGGKRVCEKCHWDQDANEYDLTHLELFG